MFCENRDSQEGIHSDRVNIRKIDNELNLKNWSVTLLHLDQGVFTQLQVLGHPFCECQVTTGGNDAEIEVFYLG